MAPRFVNNLANREFWGPTPASITCVSVEILSWSETSLGWFLKTHSVLEVIAFSYWEKSINIDQEGI